MRKLPDSPFRAALMLPSWLGDAIMASALVEPLWRLSKNPVELWGPSAYLDLFTPGEWISGYRPFEPRAVHAGLRGAFRFRHEMEGAIPDAVWIVPDSFSSALAAGIAGIRFRIGRAKEARGLLLSHRLRGLNRDRKRHWIREKADLLRPFLPAPDLADLHPRLDLFDPLPDFMQWMSNNGLSANGYVVYAPGAIFGSSKRWPLFPELTRALPQDLEIVIVGSEEDRTRVEKLEREIRVQGRPVRSLVAALPLSRLARLFQNARFTVSNDSGAMHHAAVAGASVLGLFLSTDPDWTAPVGPCARHLAASVPCRPCFRPDCPLPDRLCGEDLAVDRVLEALGDWLGGP